MNRLPFALLAAFALSYPAAADDPLAKQLDAVFDAPEFKRARWGVLAADAKTGDPLYERNADKFFAPASVAKLFTAAGVLAEFGTDFRFETPVFARGEVQNGVLKGDLILRASGDPSFGGRNTPDGPLAFTDGDHTYANSGLVEPTWTDTDPLAALTDLAGQVKAAGIKEVQGEVLIDDRLFAHTRSTGSGPEVASPVMVNDNVVDVRIEPGAKAGEAAKVTTRPVTSVVTLDAAVDTAEKGTPASITLNQVGAGQFTVRGRVPAGGKAVCRFLPVDDPAGFARSLFVEALRREGVKVAAAVVRTTTVVALPTAAEYQTLMPVASFFSAPMGETLKVTLKTSHNLYATAMPCLVAAKAGKRTQDDGLKIQKKHLAALGVDVDGLSLASGAGGSGADLATPRATVQLLQGLRKREDWDAIRGWLPRLGEDGTLKAVGTDSPARGKVFAKTGTNGWYDTLNARPLLKSRTFAGGMTTEDGREVLFAIFLNDLPLEKGATDVGEKALVRACEVIYQHRPAK